MFENFRAGFRRFNEATDAIRTIAFWLWILFGVGCATGFIGVQTQSWIREIVGNVWAGDVRPAPIVSLEPPNPIVVTLGR
jgi:hypothetical protein